MSTKEFPTVSANAGLRKVAESEPSFTKRWGFASQMGKLCLREACESRRFKPDASCPVEGGRK